MRHFFDILVQQFGYTSLSDFSDSFVHKNFLSIFIFIPISLCYNFAERYIGISWLGLTSFVCLITLELITGLMASKKLGKKIQSRKFSRFGLKIFVWLSLLFIVNSMAQEYMFKDDSKIIYNAFYYLHTILFAYVNSEYLISVLENMSILTGKDNTKLIRAVTNKFGVAFGIEKDERDDFFEGSLNYSYLCIISMDGYIFQKIDDDWKELAGVDLVGEPVVKYTGEEFITELKQIKVSQDNVKMVATFNGEKYTLIGQITIKNGQYLCEFKKV